MNQVVHGFADERMRDDWPYFAQISACGLRRNRPKQKVVSIGNGTAGRGEPVRCMEIVEASHRLAGRVDRCYTWCYGNISQEIWYGPVLVSP